MRRSVVIIIALAVGLIGACAPSATPTDPPVATPSPAASDAGIPLADRLEAEIAVEGSPDWPLAAFDSIWVLAPDLPLVDDSATPNLIRIDPATNEVAATIPLPDRLCQGFTASEDAIWACAADALIRIDPATNAITDTVPITGSQYALPARRRGWVPVVPRQQRLRRRHRDRPRYGGHVDQDVPTVRDGGRDGLRVRRAVADHPG